MFMRAKKSLDATMFFDYAYDPIFQKRMKRSRWDKLMWVEFATLTLWLPSYFDLGRIKENRAIVKRSKSISFFRNRQKLYYINNIVSSQYPFKYFIKSLSIKIHLWMIRSWRKLTCHETVKVLRQAHIHTDIHTHVIFYI